MRRVPGTLLVALAACLWGTWPVFLHDSPLAAANQAMVALGVVVAIALPVAVIAAARRRTGERPGSPPGLEPATPRLWILLVLLGLGDGANNLLYFRGLTAGSAAAAAITHYLAPVLVAALAPIFLRERLARTTPAAVALAFAGTALLLGLAGGGAGRAWAGGSASALCGAGSAVFYAANVLLTKRLVRAFSAVEVLAYHFVVSVLVLLPFAGPWHVPASAFARPIAGGLVCGLLAGLLYVRGLARTTAQRAGVLSYLEPAVVVLVAWMLLGQRPGPGAAAGGLLVLLGGALCLRDGRRHLAVATSGGEP